MSLNGVFFFICVKVVARVVPFSLLNKVSHWSSLFLQTIYREFKNWSFHTIWNIRNRENERLESSVSVQIKHHMMMSAISLTLESNSSCGNMRWQSAKDKAYSLIVNYDGLFFSFSLNIEINRIPYYGQKICFFLKFMFNFLIIFCFRWNISISIMIFSSKQVLRSRMKMKNDWIKKKSNIFP